MPLHSRPSTLHLPQGDWPTVLDCLCERFPAIDRATWLDRMARGRVLDADMQPIDAARPYRVGMRVHYFREVPNETPVPFEERILHVDEHLVVADKPHFLSVMPAGEYVNETLLARLCKRLGNADLVPIHRIDRLTAGLVLFSANREPRRLPGVVPRAADRQARGDLPATARARAGSCAWCRASRSS